MDFANAFNLISIIYAFFAVDVIVRLVRARGRTFDNVFTATDRRLAGAAAFYLLTPIAVLLHELGHALATWALGGRVAEFNFMFYWGSVLPAREPSFAPLEMAVLAAAGNIVSLLLGFAAIAWTLLAPRNAAFNFVRLEFARVILGLTLFFYPILSLLVQQGDFWILRESLNEVSSHLGDLALGLYAGFGLALWWVWRRGPWKDRYVWLATPLADQVQSARMRIARDPSDAIAWRDLGRTFLSGSNIDAGIEALRKALSLRRDDPQAHWLLGVAFLKNGRFAEASNALREAGELLESGTGPTQPRAELLYEVMLALAMTRLALGDPEGAVLTAEAARVERAEDPRASIVLADALVAAGRPGEARAKLEDALGGAQGPFAVEIRRRLESIAKPSS